MSVAVTCPSCAEDVVFEIEGEEPNPREKCDCGDVFELRVKRVVP